MKNKPKKTAIFLWEGIDANGMRTKGECEASDLVSAKIIFKQNHITVLKIKKKPISFFSAHKNKITSKHITAFTKELSTLIAANIPLLSSLEISEKNAMNLSLKKMIAHMRQALASGQSFSDALKKFPVYFDETFRSLIEAGENSGMLSLMLNRITSYHEKSENLKHTLKKALFYPITVFIISMIVTIAMLVFIVPQFSDLFHNVGAELPLLTQCVLNISHYITHYGMIIFLLLLCMAIFTHVRAKKSTSFKIFLDGAFFKIPLFGSILKQSILARSFSTLSVLLRAGIPGLEAIHLTEKVSGNSIYQKAFSDIAKKMTAGHSLHQSVEETKKFPESVIQMIAIGEASGTLEDMLENLGRYFQERVDDIAHNLSLLLEPAIMIFLCLVVGTVIIAMYLPIFKLGTVI